MIFLIFFVSGGGRKIWQLAKERLWRRQGVKQAQQSGGGNEGGKLAVSNLKKKKKIYTHTYQLTYADMHTTLISRRKKTIWSFKPCTWRIWLWYFNIYLKEPKFTTPPQPDTHYLEKAWKKQPWEGKLFFFSIFFILFFKRLNFWPSGSRKDIRL